MKTFVRKWFVKYLRIEFRLKDLRRKFYEVNKDRSRKPLPKMLYGITDSTIGKYIAVPMRRFPRFYKILDKDMTIVARFVHKSYIENVYGWHRETRDYVTLPHRVSLRAEEIKESMNGIMERWVKQVENGREAVKNLEKDLPPPHIDNDTDTTV